MSAYKQQRGIDGNIYILNATPIPISWPSIPAISGDMAQGNTQVFAAFYDLPKDYLETNLHAFNVVDSRADTLTQSQMLKADDSAEFIKSQVPEIGGVEKLRVFKYCQMSQLLP